MLLWFDFISYSLHSNIKNPRKFSDNVNKALEDFGKSVKVLFKKNNGL